MLSDKERATLIDLDQHNRHTQQMIVGTKRRKITHDSEAESIIKDSKQFIEPKENRYTQPFSYCLESASDEGTSMNNNGY